jgi:hypothetical protein
MRVSKFNVSKDKSDRTCDNIVFDSVLEMKYYRDVILPKCDSKKIKHFERQKKYILQPSYMLNSKKVQPIIYKADFYIVYSDGREEVIDIKGCPDAVAKLKKKMFGYIYPKITYLWMSFSRTDGGWLNYEDIQKARKLRKKTKKGNKKEIKDNE